MLRIQALPAEPFAALFALDDAALHARAARHVVVHACPGFSCRISLQDALPGETVVLLHHLDHDVDSPYRASGPVFVQHDAAGAEPEVDVVPQLFRNRLLSVRGYDADGRNLRGADVVSGTELESALHNLFEDPHIAYLHLQHARAGCHAALVTRS